MKVKRDNLVFVCANEELGDRNESVFLNAGRCSFERIWLHFKAIFRRLSGAIAVAPLPKAGATSPRWNPLPKA